jgi:tetratricopeptide (TPR) repeat protein
MLALALIGSTLASRQARFWKDQVTYLSKGYLGSPQDVRIQNRLNAALLSTRRSKVAANRFERLVARHPDNLRARLHLARATGESEKAITHLEWLVQADPADAKAHMALASAYSNTGRTERVEVELKAVLALDRSNLYAREHLARLYETVSRHEKAIAEYQALLRMDRDPTRLSVWHLRLAALYAKRGNLEEANAEWQKAGQRPFRQTRSGKEYPQSVE